MKKSLIFALVFILSFVVGGCDPKWPQNGKLDGMWQVMEIAYAENDIIHPERMYYSIQLNLITLNQIGQMQGVNAKGIEGYFRYTGDSLHLDMHRTSVEELARFGLLGLKDSFKVDQLTRSRLILSASGRRISCRKY